MSLHACLDCLFSEERRQLRRETRQYFSELANIPADQWTIKISDYGPCLYSDYQGHKIRIEPVFYDFCVDGVRYWCQILRDEPTDICGTREYRGSFSMDPHPFNIFGPRYCDLAYSGYVDRLYTRVCRQLKKEIKVLKQQGITSNHNSEMEQSYDKYMRRLSPF